MSGTGFDWAGLAGSALGAIGSIGGGMAGAGSSSDGFSKKGFGQWLAAQNANAELLGEIDARKLTSMARSAKIHPLALVGINPSNGPVIAGQSGDSQSIGYGIENAFRGMGQDIKDSRLRQSTQTARDLDNLETTIRIRNEELRGQYMAEDLRRLRNPPAPEPSPTGNNNQQILKKPAEVIAGTGGAQHGSNPSEAYFSRREPKTGKVVHFRGKGEKFTEATEEDFAENLAYNVHKGIVVLSGSFTPPYNPPTNVPLKKGYVWKWNTQYPYQGWYQAPSMKTHWKNQRKKGLEYYRKGGKYIPTPDKYY